MTRQTTGARIFLSAPDIRMPERRRLNAAVESGWAAPAGPALDDFEAALAERTGRAEAVALSSGTAAIHLALLGLGVGPGDDVLAPTFTFVATVGPIVQIGARPVLIDSEPTSWNLSPALLAEELNERRQANRLPAAVIAVDLYGRCADYDEITRLCAEVEVPLIEDAAEALGATSSGRPAGSFGEMAVLSFNGNKIITASGGGALVCDDPATAERARYLATQARQPEVHYEHTEIGFNYRLSNLLAAFGHGQLETLDERIERRRTIRYRYAEALADVPGVEVAPTDERGEDNAWLTCILVDPDQCPRSPEDIRLALEAGDIESRPLWKPMHLQPALDDAPARLDGTAERLFGRGLCLPSGSGMTEEELERVINALRSAFG